MGVKILTQLGSELPGRDAYYVVIGGVVIDGAVKYMVAHKLLVNFLGMTAQGAVANISEEVTKAGRFFKQRTRENAIDECPLFFDCFVVTIRWWL